MNDIAPTSAAMARIVPGNSVREMGERMNGGAVKDERSPEKDAILRKSQARVASEGSWTDQIGDGV